MSYAATGTHPHQNFTNLLKFFFVLKWLHIGKERKNIGHYHVNVASYFALLFMLSPSGGHMPLCEKSLDKINTSHIMFPLITFVVFSFF